jgi:hypothetical protein
MDDRTTERMAAVLDSASTWHGVTWSGDGDTQILRLDGRLFGRVTDGRLEVAFPGRLAEAVVRHDMAERHEDAGWTTLDFEDVQEAVALLRFAYLSQLARLRRWRSAYPDIDLDEEIAELDLSPGLIHLVRELPRKE